MPYNIDKRGKSLTIITVSECYSYLYSTFIVPLYYLHSTFILPQYYLYRMFNLKEKKWLSLQLNAKGCTFAQL